jgi:hypothetical protein
VAEADRLRRASRVVYGVGGAAVAVGALFTLETVVRGISDMDASRSIGA